MTPSGRVVNKIALVTGAASGIGRATALLLANEGASVVVADIAAETGQHVVEEISRNGGKAVFLTLDVTQEAAWQDVTDRILHEFASLDIAVNNAGVAVSRPVTEMTLAEWRRVFQINLDGVFLGTKYAIRAMQVGALSTWPRLRASRRLPKAALTVRARQPSACSRKRSLWTASPLA